MKRFWDKVKKSDRCWEWTAGRYVSGYGTFRHKNKSYYAHRMSYEFVIGPIPQGKHVLHKCDNPPCVNPDHLFIGTPLDNARDRAAKGRQVLNLKNLRKALPGEGHYNAKLTWEKVRSIRKEHKVE